MKVTEIFRSIQGESTFAGLPCAFVRLAGCPLRCSYCDTAYAQGGGREMSVADVVERVAALGDRLVEVTGGEPLAQEEVYPLLSALLERDHTILLETSGAVPTDRVDPRVVTILDVKCPGSGEAGTFIEGNLDRLRPRDEVKFVLTDRADYDWAREFLRTRPRLRDQTVIFSPVSGRLPWNELAEWILDDRLSVRLGLQLHKLIWGEVPGR
ncbi:MAG: 7-carboxy-7-deazaguanine synthase QueE [Nitrospirae bacterium RBG_16_64_22]|nr:MAG: 7-carboxy-7-deazaguanine synthase QueE [Nitrospirae bacterium RBG_16_64_22]